MDRLTEYRYRLVASRWVQGGRQRVCAIAVVRGLCRWRALVGEDPDEDQLAAKIQLLEERLSFKKEQLLEKDLVLEEVRCAVGVELPVWCMGCACVGVCARVNLWCIRLCCVWG